MHQPLRDALLDVDRVTASRLVAEHVRNHGPLSAVDQLIAPSLDIIGHAWDRGDVSLSQVFVAARLCEEIVTPWLPDSGHLVPDQPRLGIAVLEDSHSLGKRIVTSVLRAAGYEVHDYGAGVEPVALADRAVDDGADILLISTLMLRSALDIRLTVDRLQSRGFRGQVMVGGAPFRMDETIWREVGANAMGRTSADALTLVAAARRGER